MSIKDHALLVSLTVNKPQMTQKDHKATVDAEQANNAHGAGQYRKDLYPRTLIQPILTVESAARAYLDSTCYTWNRGEYLLPNVRCMSTMDRMSKFQLEFDQTVTAFLNNWANVMDRAKQAQGALFDPSAYPDLSDLKRGFRFRVMYRPITDASDFRVALQEEELALVKQIAEQDTREAMNSLMQEPLKRLREVIARLHETTGKADRKVINKRTGHEEIRPPIFRDTVCENIIEEIDLLHAFADVLPDNVLEVAKTTVDMLPRPSQLRDDPEVRAQVNKQSEALLAAIDTMLED